MRTAEETDPVTRTRKSARHRELLLSLHTTRAKPIMASVRRCVAALLAVFALAIGSADASAFLATDKTFDSAVLGSGKHAFVKFLAPWCVRAFARARVNCRAASRCFLSFS